MFALIKTGGKQYKVAQDNVVVVEKLDAEAGETVAFEHVLLVCGEAGTKVGAPLVTGARVEAEVLEQRKGDKVLIVKNKRRNTYKRHKGHRQLETVVKITGIFEDGAAPTKKAKAKAEKPAAVAAAPAALKFLDAPKGKADDLKDISGVGPSLEKKLNALGIFHFWQIAEMEVATLEAVDAEIGFKGRAIREDWVGQSKHLMAGGAPLAASDRAAKAEREDAEANEEAPKRPRKKKTEE
jgi:large subunit ribosomal protein L21